MERINRIARYGFTIVFVSACVAGCGQSASNETATAAAAAPDAAAAPNPSTEAIAQAASDFLDAVLKGDTQRASARLTPQAMQRIIASGKQFAPPGLETAAFTIGEVRSPAQGHAFVQCVLTDASNTETPRREEMCCMMRQVDNDWRVAGIAYWTGPNQPGSLSNFETGQTTAIPRQGSMQNSAGQPSTPGQPSQPGRPSPPRTAQDPATSTVR